MKRLTLLTATLIALSGIISCTQTSSVKRTAAIPATVTLTKERLMDKIKGGWAGQTIMSPGMFYKTIDIATRCGQDSDCNPASAGGIRSSPGILYDTPPRPVLEIPTPERETYGDLQMAEPGKRRFHPFRKCGGLCGEMSLEEIKTVRKR